MSLQTFRSASVLSVAALLLILFVLLQQRSGQEATRTGLIVNALTFSSQTELQYASVRPGVCDGEVPAGASLKGGAWMHPAAGTTRRPFNPDKCCRDRYHLLEVLGEQGFNGAAIELGVASGGYSREILRRTSFSTVFSTDMWANDRGHDDAQRAIARGAVSEFGNRSCVLWSKFDEVAPTFPESFFDFIYIDGYAHTGEEGGQTLNSWYGKLRSGGVFAGHDYSSMYKMVIEAVDKFAGEHQLAVHKIGPADKKLEPFADNDCCSTWFVVKP